MKRAFVDTSALLPLIDAEDRDHEAVAAAVAQCATDNVELWTCSYTLVETGALVRKRLGAEAFRALGPIIDAAMRIVWVDEAQHRRAWEHTSREGRRGASLVDWAGFLVMKDLGITTALTLDQHFREQGFEILPPSPP